MLAALFSIMPVFGIILAGYVAGRTGVIAPAAHRELNRFVIWLALPALMFWVVATTDWRSLWDGNFIIASVGGSLAVFVIGMFIGRRRGLPIADIAVDGLNACYSNSAYIGLPLFLIALGPESSPYVIVAATLTLMLLFALAITSIELGHNRARGVGHALGKAALGVIRNPVMVGPLAGLGWWLTGYSLPRPVDEFTHMLGLAASPAALVSIGLFLSERSLANALKNPAVLALSSTKLLLRPLLTGLIVLLLPDMGVFSATMAISIAALPTGTGPFMLAGFYARDGAVTSGTIFLSTLLSVFIIAACLTFLPR